MSFIWRHFIHFYFLFFYCILQLNKKNFDYCWRIVLIELLKCSFRMTNLRLTGTWLPNDTEWLQLGFNYLSFCYPIMLFRAPSSRGTDRLLFSCLSCLVVVPWKFGRPKGRSGWSFSASVLEPLLIFHGLLPFTLLFLKKHVPPHPRPMALSLCHQPFKMPRGMDGTCVISGADSKVSFPFPASLTSWQAHSHFKYCSDFPKKKFTISEPYLLTDLLFYWHCFLPFLLVPLWLIKYIV